MVRPVQPAGATTAEETRFTVNTPKYEAVLSSKGARIISFKLKDYTVVSWKRRTGKPVRAAGTGHCRSRRSCSHGETKPSTMTSWVILPIPRPRPVSLDKNSKEKSITFHATTAAGLTISKTFRFHAESYAVDFSFTLTNNSDEDRNYLITFPWRKVYRGEEASQRFSWNSAEILIDHTLKDYYFKDIKGG